MKILAWIILVKAVALSIGSCAEMRTLEYKLPARVAEITRKQIERYFGTNDLNGLPLLDRAVNWNVFTNWPDQFKYKGRIYQLRLLDTSGGDYSVGIKSRAEVQPGMQLFARYSTGTNLFSPLSISCVWRGDGSVLERTVDVENKRVFGHQFFPTGQLYLFLRDDWETKEYALEYFDSSGADR